MENKQKIRSVMFASRNKDNDRIEGFKERRKTFLSDMTDEELISKFKSFVEAGKQEELSRLYVSINPRNNDKIHKNVLHYLIDNPQQDMSKFDNKITSIASKYDCRDGNKWMFDYDEDVDLIDEFIADIHSCDAEVVVETYETPNGLCVVTSRGFDIRGLDLENKWKNVELKKDGFRCLYWGKNE